MHACRSPSKMLKEDDYMPIISPESPAIHGEKTHFDLQSTAEGGLDLSGKAKAVAELGEEEEPAGGSQPPPCSFDPGAMLAAGQSPLWAVLICAGHGCLPGGSVAAGDYWGQGHPPFSLPRTTRSDGQGQGLGEKEPQPCCKVSSVYLSPAASWPGLRQLLAIAGHACPICSQQKGKYATGGAGNCIFYSPASFLICLYTYINKIYIFYTCAYIWLLIHGWCP